MNIVNLALADINTGREALGLEPLDAIIPGDWRSATSGPVALSLGLDGAAVGVYNIKLPSRHAAEKLAEAWEVNANLEARVVTTPMNLALFVRALDLLYPGIEDAGVLTRIPTIDTRGAVWTSE